MNMIVARLIFGGVGSLIFVIYFVMSSFAIPITYQNNQGLSSNDFYTLPPPLSRIQKGEYAPNT